METEKIIYGRKPVLEYLKSATAGSGAQLFVYQNAHGKIIDVIIGEAKRKKIAVAFRDKDFFRGISGSSDHQGMALRLDSPRARDDDRDLLEHAALVKGVLVLLDEITDPHNAGSIIRTAEALGCHGVLMTKSNSPGINATVVKASAGATAHIGIGTVTNITGFLEGAKKNGFWIIGTGEEGEKSPADTAGFRPAIVIIGSEGKGMRRVVEEHCDFMVRIPLRGKVQSLNASVAAGIVLYEMMKQ